MANIKQTSFFRSQMCPNSPAPYFTFFPYLNEHDVIVERPGFVIIMSDNGRDWENLFKALHGVDAVFSQDHLHHAAPTGAKIKRGSKKYHQTQVGYSDQSFNVTWQNIFFWLKSKNEDQLENRSYLRSPAVGGRHHPLWVDEGASTEVVAHKKKRGLVLDGVRLHHYSPNDSLPKHSWERMREFINNYMPYFNILH